MMCVACLNAMFIGQQELMYKRVRFIENPWYDDHFDIPTERQRIGKTITVLTSSNDNPLNRGYQLIGLALYEKLDKVVGMMQQWLADPAVSPCINSVEVFHCKILLKLHILK